jgi:PleD family two-component response regulator
MSDAAVISRAPLNGTPGTSGLAGAVLIIDDEAEIRESLQTLLEMEGFAVEAAPTGEAGLQRVGENH